MATITTADLLDQFARALWDCRSSIDGRSEQTALNSLSAAIREHGNSPLGSSEILGLRDDMDLCLHGGGHWTNYCNERWADWCKEMTQ